MLYQLSYTRNDGGLSVGAVVLPPCPAAALMVGVGFEPT